MENNHLSHQQLHILLKKYILCLDMYFSALQEACQRARNVPSTKTHSADNTSIEILEKFIIVGKKLQRILDTLQKHDSHF